MKTKAVHVLCERAAISESLLSALESLTPVDMQTRDHDTGDTGPDALIELPPARGSGRSQADPSTHRLRIECSGEPGSSHGADVRFGCSMDLDRRLRGRTLPHAPIQGIGPIEILPGDDVLAHYGDLPVWVKRREQNHVVDIVSTPPPRPAPDQHLFDYLNGDHFMQVLPWLHFLREVTSDIAWAGPSLRSCFMFDDPNLHWHSYGCISYKGLIEQAKARNYHVAIATVPLDGWFVHRPTARLLREHPDRLSLLIHGNDHTRGELAHHRGRAERLRFLAQCLQRVEVFERRAGLRVDRVMAPPHGAHSESMMPDMLALGFEGACISPGSLRGWAKGKQWAATFGLEPAQIMADGFPVLPRFRLSPSCEGDIVIAAFLDRPIIPVGHHASVADGLDLLARLAGIVNSFEGVQWQGVESILRSNFCTRMEGESLALRPFSQRIALDIPPHVDTLRLIPPVSAPTTDRDALFITRDAAAGSEPKTTRAGEPIRVRPGSRIEIVSTRLGVVDFHNIAAGGPRMWPVLRRALCESRDRCFPLIRRLAARHP